jgi:hypothetical protein
MPIFRNISVRLHSIYRYKVQILCYSLGSILLQAQKESDPGPEGLAKNVSVRAHVRSKKDWQETQFLQKAPAGDIHPGVRRNLASRFYLGKGDEAALFNRSPQDADSIRHT